VFGVKELGQVELLNPSKSSTVALVQP